MDKRIKESIQDVLRQRPGISTEEAVEIVKIYAEKPDPAKLEEQYYRRLANRILASFRDDSNVRECFNIRTVDGERIYINVPTTTDKQLLDKAKKTLAAKYRGLNRSLKKVQRRELELAGQLSMFENEAKREVQ